KGLSVRARTLAMAASSSGRVIVAAARMPRPPASLVAAVRRAPDTQPMPVWTLGYWTPKSSHRRVCRGFWAGARGASAGAAAGAAAFLARAAAGLGLDLLVLMPAPLGTRSPWDRRTR